MDRDLIGVTQRAINASQRRVQKIKERLADWCEQEDGGLQDFSEEDAALLRQRIANGYEEYITTSKRIDRLHERRKELEAGQ